jgi:hypothetical protein
MRSTRNFVSAAVLAALALAAFLSPGGAAARTPVVRSAQNLTITATGTLSGLGGPTSGAFELQGASGAETDIGKLAFTAPSAAPLGLKTPEGLWYVPLRITVTFTGKHGTLVVRTSARQFDVVKIDDSIATGTWSVVKGSGRYAGLNGGGALLGIQRAAGTRSISDYVYSYRFQGHVFKA